MNDPDPQATVKAPLSAEHLKVRIDLRVAQLRVLAAQTALDYWRPRPPCSRPRLRSITGARARLGTLSRRPEQVGEDENPDNHRRGPVLMVLPL